MKNLIKRISILLLFPLAFTCCDLLDSEDPPSAEEELQRMMPYTQYLISYWTGTDNARFALQWTQQIGGVRGVHLDVDKYDLKPEYLNTVWDLYYQYIFADLATMIDHATRSDSKAYRGICRILKAYSIGMMTDAWGDIPYEYGLNKYGAYDEQQFIIITIYELLGQAIVDLDAAENSQGFKPGPDEDLIYGGDLHKWKRAANVIRLRYLLRMERYNDILNHIGADELFTSNNDNMLYYFPGGDRVNPHYYFDNRFKNTRAGKYIVNLLKDNNDPRLPVYIRLNNNNEYVGTGPGEALSSASYLSSHIASEESPVMHLTYSEQKFIEAEAYFHTEQQSLADQAYEEAVKASLSLHDVSDAEWEAEHAAVEDVTLEQIITAKYVALFLDPEVWADFRRTGYPELQPYDHEDNPDAQIPRRYLYPEDQQTWNYMNVPEDVTIYDRVWWDQE